MFRFRLPIVSMLLLVLFSPINSYADLDEAAMMTQAKSHYQEGGFYYATTWLERVLKNWPNTPRREEVLLMMAKAYVATDRDEKASRTIKSLLHDFPQARGKLDQTVLEFMARQEELKGPYLSSLPDPVAPAKPAQPSIAVPAPAAKTVVAAPAGVIPAPAEIVPTVVESPKPVEKSRPAELSSAIAGGSADEDTTASVQAKPADLAPAEKEVATVTAETERTAVAAKRIGISATAPGKDAVQPVVAEKAPVPESSVACSAGNYFLELGEYVGKNRLARVRRAVEKAGLDPVVVESPKKTVTMLRIQVGEFQDRQSVEEMSEKLRGVKVEHFVLKDKHGVSRVYAGSYHDKAAAVAERRRLAAKGVRAELKEVTVPVSSLTVTAGCFADEASARMKMAELERLGVKGKVLLRW